MDFGGWGRALWLCYNIITWIGIESPNKFEINPSLAEHDMPALANSVGPDQLASSEANWSGSALFVIKYVNFY